MRVWMHSMQVRYFMEVAVYLMMAIFFTVMMLYYNANYQKARKTILLLDTWLEEDVLPKRRDDLREDLKMY